MKPSASTASVISNSGEAIFGSTTVAASGRKISAAPKPEKPRAVAATKALASRKASRGVERSEGRRSSMAGEWSRTRRSAGAPMTLPDACDVARAVARNPRGGTFVPAWNAVFLSNLATREALDSKEAKEDDMRKLALSIAAAAVVFTAAPALAQ